MIDVALAIDEEAITVSHIRDGAGSYSHGKFTPGAPVTTPIRATIQPAGGRSLADMPEGIRQEAKFIAWSRVPLLNADRIIYASTTYKVIFVWSRPADGFYRAAIGEMKPA